MTLTRVRALIREDITAFAEHAAAFQGGSSGGLRRLSILLTPSLMCASLHRLAHWSWQTNRPRLAAALARLNQTMHKATIHPASQIGGGVYIPHTVGIVFHGQAGDRLVLFTGAVVLDARLADNVSLGTRAVVSGPVFVAAGVKVAPFAVVKVDVPPAVIAYARRARPNG
jgi:serine O-acetyltransferase